MKLEWRDVVLREGYPAINTSLTLAETEELQRLARGEVLEIGSAYGYSAIAMAMGRWGAAYVTAVDPHQQLGSYHTMRANLGAYGVEERVNIHQGGSPRVLEWLLGQGSRFDLVFIDGDHSVEAVGRDVFWARKLLRETGTLACHDYDEDTCPGVKQWLDSWKVPPKLVDTLAIYGPGEW